MVTSRIEALEQECMIGSENAPLLIYPATNETHLEIPGRVRSCVGYQYESRDSAQTALVLRLAYDKSPVALWPCAGHWHLDDLD